MKYLFWILAIFAAAVAISAASDNNAYVQLVYPPYRIDISLTLFGALLLLVFLLGYGLVRLTGEALTLPAKARKFRLERAQLKSRELLHEVLSTFFEGRYAASEKAAARAIEAGETSALHPIIAARSAHELGEFKKRDVYLATAEGKQIGDTTMRLMAATKFMLDQHDPQAALEALQKLRESGVKGHLGALSLELKAHQKAGNWDAVLRVLGELEKRAAIDKSVAAQFRQEAWLQIIRQQKDLTGLLDCLKRIPSNTKLRGKFAASAAKSLLQLGGASHAQALITDSLNAQWDGDLVALYGDCPSDDLLAQIEQAETWLGQHRQEPGLLLALGKLCLHQKLWGKAQNYLDASISLAPSHDAYQALGLLAQQMGQSDQAVKYFQLALTIETN